MDSTFSEDGFTQTGVAPPTMYSRPMGVLPNGNIVLGGLSINPLQLKVNTYNPNGDSISTIMHPYTANVDNGATAIKILDDGKMLFTNASTQLFRYFADGTLDSTFGVNGIAPLYGAEIREIVTAPNGKIFAVGQDWPGGVVLAFDANGRPDSTFSEDGVFNYQSGDLDFFYSIRLQGDGKIVVCGFSYYNSIGRPSTLIRIMANGVLDPSFGEGGVWEDNFSGGGEAYGMAIQADQKILITGYTIPPYHAVVARYLPDGNRDSTFGQFGISNIPQVSEGTDIIIKPDGKILVYGWYNQNSDTHKTALIQLLPDGSFDPSFGNNGIYLSPYLGMMPPMTFNLLDDNKIIACGAKSFYTSNSVVRYLALQRFIMDFNVGTISPKNSQFEAGLFIYPNPVTTSLTLKFNLEFAENLDLEILDLNGKPVQIVRRNHFFEAGEHEESIQLDGNIPSGQYVLSLWASGKKVIGIQFSKI